LTCFFPFAPLYFPTSALKDYPPSPLVVMLSPPSYPLPSPPRLSTYSDLFFCMPFPFLSPRPPPFRISFVSLTFSAPSLSVPPARSIIGRVKEYFARRCPPVYRGTCPISPSYDRGPQEVRSSSLLPTPLPTLCSLELHYSPSLLPFTSSSNFGSSL